MNDQMQWLLDLTQSMNTKLTELTGILAGHSMALKILGTAIALIITGLITLFIEQRG